jgi:hypothetical protein
MQLHGADVTYGAFEWSKQTSRRTSSARKSELRTSVPRFATPPHEEPKRCVPPLRHLPRVTCGERNRAPLRRLLATNDAPASGTLLSRAAGTSTASRPPRRPRTLQPPRTRQGRGSDALPARRTALSGRRASGEAVPETFQKRTGQPTAEYRRSAIDSISRSSERLRPPRAGAGQPARRERALRRRTRSSSA